MQEYRDRMKEINVRPIKKVVEAKARKKRRATSRMERAKKKADMISENMGMSDYDKAQQIRTYVLHHRHIRARLISLIKLITGLGVFKVSSSMLLVVNVI